jgi:hypothetical protein
LSLGKLIQIVWSDDLIWDSLNTIKQPPTPGFFLAIGIGSLI